MLLNIQALRAIAALLVVLVHLQVLGAALGLQRSLFDLFAVGVDLFFVISGFIMVHTTSRRRVSPAAFMLGRLVRIAPLYWTLTVAVFVLALASPSLLGATQGDWAALLRSLAFLPGARADGTVQPILFVGWSLNLEMAFYLVFALTLTVKGLTRRVLLGAGLLVLAVALGALLRPRLGPELRFLMQPMLLEFAAGMIVGWLHPHLPASRIAARLAAAASLPALATLLLAVRWPLPGGWPVSLLPACAVVLAALIAEKGGIVLTWQPLQVTGDASYALYLTHPFVTQGWTIAAERSGILQPGTAPLLMAAALGSAVAAGIFIHRHLERPLGRLLQSVPAGTPGMRFLKSGALR